MMLPVVKMLAGASVVEQEISLYSRSPLNVPFSSSLARESRPSLDFLFCFVLFCLNLLSVLGCKPPQYLVRE